MNEKYKGIACIVLSAFFFALMNMFVRLSGDLPSIQKSFFRNLIAFLIAIVAVKKNNIHFSKNKGNGIYLFLRSAFGTIGILCNFYAIDHLPLADASMLNKMSPFFAILFSIIILNEKVKPAQALIVLTAFIGSLFIIKPTGANLELIPALAGFFGGVCAGAAYTYVRKLSSCGEKGPIIVAFFSGFSCLVTLPFLIFQFHPMSAAQLVILLLAGASAAGGQFTITAAYSYAPAREISVYDYSQIIFAAGLGFLVFGQIPDIYSWIGYVIIIAMAITMFWYNNRRVPQS
jgi:drug/metabolite transporter (DMT)-like permease